MKRDLNTISKLDTKNFINNHILKTNMVNVFCEQCNYRFSAKKGKPFPKKCPYCDAKDTVKEVKSAQDWLDEVSSLKDV